jgi:hypothetical protein
MVRKKVFITLGPESITVANETNFVTLVNYMCKLLWNWLQVPFWLKTFIVAVAQDI